MGHTKIENWKALYSFYENTGICFTSLSSSRKSSNQKHDMLKSLFILNWDWEVQAFLNMILIHFCSLSWYPALALWDRNYQQCLSSISNIWNHLGTYHMQGWQWLLCQLQFLMHKKYKLGYVTCPLLKSFWIQHESCDCSIEQNSLGDFIFPVQMPRGTHSLKKQIKFCGGETVICLKFLECFPLTYIKK